nr:hypothetical protein [Streptomyces regalis]
MTTPDLDLVLGENGALFDVALDVDVGRGEAYVDRSVEAGAGEFPAEGETFAVGQGVGVLQGQAAGGDGTAEHVGAEADALLLGEEADLDGAAGGDAEVVQGADDLDAAQDAEAAVRCPRDGRRCSRCSPSGRRGGQFGLFHPCDDLAAVSAKVPGEESERAVYLECRDLTVLAGVGVQRLLL